MKTIYSQQNDTISRICWREYGQSLGMVEKVLEANPKLCDMPAILPIGTAINIPPVNARSSGVIRESVKLWD